jgi:radical SAM protein with 4Fe4S-binding SPASM domain
MISDRIDKTTDVTDDWKKEILPCPKSVKISLDDHCNFKCSFCVNSTQTDKPRMPWEQFTALIDELVSEGVEEIGLFYIGEPMIAKKLENAIKYCKSKGIGYVFITTNGTLATPERLKPLMEAGLDSLKFSFNYTDSIQIAQIAGVKENNYDKLVENIKAARKLRDENGYKCGIYASSIVFDGSQMRAMERSVAKIIDYVDEHYWLPQYSFGGQVETKVIVRGNPGRYDRMRKTLPCWALFKEGHITAGGDVSLCCFDVHQNWRAGSLKDGSFMQAWNSEVAQNLRKAHLTGDVHGTVCEECAHGRA